MSEATYEIAPDGKSITCRCCNRTSYNSKDVQYRYCVGCDLFHLSGKTRTYADVLWIRAAEAEGIEIDGYDGGFGEFKRFPAGDPDRD